ncbi:hypothetical protein F4823DRAFT_559856 [Ustulina deusta]|nr:hypothetical protein F4823DRAFT_559856 [Ustulina deusta]
MNPLWPPPPGPGFTKYYPYEHSSFLGKNSYLLYQAYQKRFVTWLVKAAAEHGEHFHGADQSLTETFVPFNKLIRLAEVIARHGEVPQSALAHLNFLLQLRGDWDPGNEKKPAPASEPENEKDLVPEWEPKNKETLRFGWDDECDQIDDEVDPIDHGVDPIGNEADNNAHQHFLAMSTLRQVRSLLMLAPIVVGQAEFVEEDYSLPVLPGEAFFAWVCFFNDLLVIREYLKVYWHSYQQSFGSLTSAALVTNTAICLVRANCEAHIKATAHLPGMPTEYNITEWICRGITGEFAPDHTFEESWQNYEASWCCYEVQSSLKANESLDPDGWQKCLTIDHADTLRETVKAMDSQPDYGIYRAAAVDLFANRFCYFMHNIHLRGWDRDDPTLLPCFDELTTGWLLWERDPDFKMGIMPLWLTVTFQIYADIRLTLGRYSPTAVEDLKEHSRNRIELFSKYLSRTNTEKGQITELEERHNVQAKNHLFTTIQLVAKCINKDNYIRAIKRRSGLGELEFIKKYCELPEFYFLEQGPALCGMQSWWIEQQYRIFEYHALKLHEAILPAALLYVSMRRLGLIVMTRGADILHPMHHRWEHYEIWPDRLRVNMSINMHFASLYAQPPVRYHHNPLARYLAGLFTLYFAPNPREFRLYSSGPPSANTLRRIIRRVYPYPHVAWREKAIHDLREKNITNIFEVLYLVSTARYFDESMACFDWFSMHDTCKKFLDCLRDKYMESYKAYLNKDPFSGSNRPPGDESNGLGSLIALFSILFKEPSDRGTENLIMASLCIDPHATQSYDIQDIKHFFERWGDGIIWHMGELGISLESAAAVFQPLVEQEGWAVFTKAAETQRGHHKTRTERPDYLTDLYEQAERRKWYHPCHTPQTADSSQNSVCTPTSETLSNDSAAAYLQSSYDPGQNEHAIADSSSRSSSPTNSSLSAASTSTLK